MVLYLDRSWDFNPDRIILDQELNIDRLGWKNGDHFMITNFNGQTMLIKVDPIVSFSKGYKVNSREDTE